MNFIDSFEDYELPHFGFIRLPEIVINDKEREATKISQPLSNDDFLKVLLQKRYDKSIKEGLIPDTEEYRKRWKLEYDAFLELGFVDYVLLVWRVSNYCDSEDIMRDYGRGSGASSLAFYLLGITAIDPIRYGLFFERFISKVRARKQVIDGVTYIDGSLAPDYDMDVDPNRRQEVIKFLESQYPNRICKILNVTTLQGKALIKECGKIIGNKSQTEMNAVTDMIPKIFGIVADLKDAYDDEVEFRKWCDENKELYIVALQLRNIIKNFSVHASGYIVSYHELTDIMPLQLTSDKELVSCYTKDDAALFSIKLDILGSRCSAVVNDCLKSLGLDWRTINVHDDPIIYKNISEELKHPHGIFQLEADCNLRVCNQVKPRNLLELSDVVAMARPGALSFVSKYVKNEKELVHPLFDPILAQTRFCCLYQEQMMKLAHAIGFSLEEAEILRRIVGKKKVEEVKEWKAKIYEKIAEKGLNKDLGDLLWKILDDSSKYSFNLSHSVSFAALAALTLYLKYKYPLHFYLALLNQAKNEQDPLHEINLIQTELKEFGIQLLPPNLLNSGINFTIEGKNLRFGLSSLRGVSDKTIEKLVEFRKPYANKFELFESAKQCRINIGVLSALIQSGCLTNLHADNRTKLVLEAQTYSLLTVKEKKTIHQLYKMDCEKFGSIFKIIRYMLDTKDSNGKVLMKASRFETIKKKYNNYKIIYDKNSKNEKLAIYYYEKMSIGFPYTYSLKDACTEPSINLSTIYQIKNEFETKDRVKLIAEVEHAVVATSQKSKSRYMKLEVSDGTGKMNIFAFNTSYAMTLDVIREDNDRLPQEGDIIFVEGSKKDGDAIYISKLIIQTEKIYTKLSELKESATE